MIPRPLANCGDLTFRKLGGAKKFCLAAPRGWGFKISETVLLAICSGRQLRGLMRFLKSVILLFAISVGVAVFYFFGSLVGIWGGTRSSVLARDGSSSPNIRAGVREDGDGGASAYKPAKDKGERDEPTGKVNLPRKGEKKVRPPARARR
jgi:hypothetical protein